MSDQFGESYRKEVQDVNEGRGQADSIASAQKIQRSSAGREVTKLDNRGRFEGFAEFAQAAGNAAVGVANRKEKEELDIAYAEGTQEKLDELQKKEGGIWQNIFGKSATMKGFEKRVIDNEVERDYQNRLQAMPEHAKSFKTIDEYRKAIGDPLLKQALDKQSDPSVKARITAAFTKNTKLLAGQFATHRKNYEQVLNKKQVLTNVLSASRSFKLAEASGDVQIQQDAKSKMGKAIQKPRDMDEQAWENTLTTALVDRIGNSDLSLLQVMEADDKLTFFSIENKNKIDQAKDIYTRENDTRYMTKGFDIQRMIGEQDKNFESALAAYKKQYPQVNTNKLAAQYEVERQKQEAAAQILHQDKMDILSGQAVAAPKDSQRKFRANKAAEDQIMSDAAMYERADRINQQNMDGDIPEDLNASMTLQEQEGATMRSPQNLVNLWRTSGQAPTLVTKTMHELDNLILSDELDVDDEARVEEITQFLNHFNSNPNDQALFAKNMKSKEQLANYKQLTFLKDKTGKATRKALVMMRMNKDKPEVVLDPMESQSMANEALRDFTDNNGFENWLGWSTNPDNQEDLELAAAQAFDKALAITKDPNMAKNLVQDFLTFDSTRVGDKFVIGGADLDRNSYGGSYNEYVQAVQVSPQWQDKQQAAGFPRDRLITDPRNTIQVFPNGQGAVITSFAADGSTIYVDLPAPKNKYDFPSTAQQERRETAPLDFNEPVPEPDPQSAVAETKPISKEVQEVLKNEGGYQKGENDTGNYNSKDELVGTNYGISAPMYEKHIGHPPSEQEMRDMPKAVAAELHTKNLKAQNLDDVPQANKQMMAEMKTMTSARGIAKVMKAVGKPNPTNKEIWVEYEKYLKTLKVRKGKNKGQLLWKTYGKGWTNRFKPLIK